MIQKTAVCVALVAALSIIVIAEQGQPQACQDIVGLNVTNATQLSGVWHELVRAPFANTSCTNVNFESAMNGTILKSSIMYASSSTSVLMDKHMKGITNMTERNDKNGYSVTYEGLNRTIIYKFLSMDNSTYMSLCGYTPSVTNSSFGSILVRDIRFNTTLLNDIITNTSHVLQNFNFSTIANITQVGCHANSATTSVPYLTSVFAMFLLVVKFLN